jgi:hypothetical protein
MRINPVLDDQRIGFHHRLAQPDLLVVDAAERHHRRAHPFRAEARERLCVPPFEEGGDGKELGAGYHPLPATPVDADLIHLSSEFGLPPAWLRRAAASM